LFSLEEYLYSTTTKQFGLKRVKINGLTVISAHKICYKFIPSLLNKEKRKNSYGRQGMKGINWIVNYIKGHCSWNARITLGFLEET
jgi:hypothetical protein